MHCYKYDRIVCLVLVVIRVSAPRIPLLWFFRVRSRPPVLGVRRYHLDRPLWKASGHFAQIIPLNE
jgi:hypothetical protein